MCARFTIRKKKVREIAEALEAELGPDDEPLYRPRYNVAPTDLAWIVDHSGSGRVLRAATWSYVVGDGARRLINVRGESVGSGAGFREAFASRRCVVVTDGFYEWPGGKGRPPTLFHRADDGLVLLGGLYQRPRGGDDHPRDAYPRFTVLTTRPSAPIARVHDRMPVIVPEAQLDRWLEGEPAAAAALIAPAPDDALVGTLVSTHVNNVRHDDPACVVPAEPP
jgi:putative SOS response-associated peptidase YedK